jgi:hypothetical protein
MSSADNTPITLSELAGLVREVVDQTLGRQSLWVIADVANHNQKNGRHYFDLIEKDYCQTAYPCLGGRCTKDQRFWNGDRASFYQWAKSVKPGKHLLQSGLRPTTHVAGCGSKFHPGRVGEAAKRHALSIGRGEPAAYPVTGWLLCDF